MTHYVTLEPNFVGAATGNETVTSVIIFVLFVVAMFFALRAVGKRLIESRLPEETNEENN